VSKLKDDKVKDILMLDLMPDFAQALVNPRMTTEALLEKITTIRDQIENSYVNDDFRFIDSTTVDMDHTAQQVQRESGKVFGSTGYAKLDTQLTDGYADTKLTIVAGRPGMGKCHSKGTEILTYSGEIKKVEDIVVGDLLMGPDSKPRKVLTVHTGREEMFDVIPNKGDVWDAIEVTFCRFE
jgi:replicative DNA helicase